MNRPYPLSNKIFHADFGNAQGKVLRLSYYLYQHSVTAKWIKLMEESLARKMRFEAQFFGSSLNDQNELVEILNQAIDRHNDHSKRNNFDEIIPIKCKLPVSQNFLSELHVFYEKFIVLEKFYKNPPVRINLDSINIFIHRLESTLEKNAGPLVEILQKHDLMYLPIEKDEFSNFSPDTNWGELVLNYGQTGVPTIEAFNSDSHPNPQKIVTNNVRMAFYDKIFTDYHRLADWLKEKKLRAAPDSALGYIPLGILQTSFFSQKDELVKKLLLYPHFVKFSFEIQNEITAKPLPGPCLSEVIDFVVYDHDSYASKSLSDRHLSEFTLKSIHPMKPDILREGDWDSRLDEAILKEKSFLLIMAAGVYVKDFNRFVLAINHEAETLKSQGYVAAGRILDHNDSKSLPYFYESILLINLDLWQKGGRIKLGPLFTSETGTMENIWIEKKDNKVIFITPAITSQKTLNRSGKFFYGSHLIQSSLSLSYGVKSFNNEVENSILYSYPREDRQEDVEAILSHINEKLENELIKKSMLGF